MSITTLLSQDMTVSDTSSVDLVISLTLRIHTSVRKGHGL